MQVKNFISTVIFITTMALVKKLTYCDIQRFTAANLNAYCRKFRIDTTLPKCVKVNAICHCPDVSTVGESVMKMTILPLTAGALSSSQLNTLQQLTPKVLYGMTDWSSDLLDLPNINEIDVKRYLLQTNILSADYERTYKLSRPYQLKQFVNAVQTCTWLSLFCIIRARCLPSQSTNSDDVKIMHHDACHF
jgi:hypothetical protein